MRCVVYCFSACFWVGRGQCPHTAGDHTTKLPPWSRRSSFRNFADQSDENRFISLKHLRRVGGDHIYIYIITRLCEMCGCVLLFFTALWDPARTTKYKFSMLDE